jgi:hypothetical protein
LSVIRGTIITVYGEVWKGDERTLPFYPDRDEAVVLHTFSYALDYVRWTGGNLCRLPLSLAMQKVVGSNPIIRSLKPP